jgi:hypothetical protein
MSVTGASAPAPVKVTWLPAIRLNGRAFGVAAAF